MIAARGPASVILPSLTLKTSVESAPANAGLWALKRSSAFWDSVPGIEKSSAASPPAPAAAPRRTMTTTAAGQAALPVLGEGAREAGEQFRHEVFLTRFVHARIAYQIAVKAGVKAEIANAIAEGRRPAQMSDEETILFDFCQELHHDKLVSDATYARALKAFGEQGVMDTIGISGYYTLLAMVLNTARTPAGE